MMCLQMVGPPTVEELMGSTGITNSIASGARLPSLMPSRIFVTAPTIECFIVLSGFVLQIKHHYVLFSSYLYVTNVIAMYLYSLPQTSGTQIIFVYLRSYQDCLYRALYSHHLWLLLLHSSRNSRREVYFKASSILP